MKVTLILDPSCGEALAALDQPLWACDSPINRPVAERLRSLPNIDPMAVTTFKMSSESLDESGADIIPTIDEHHPQWTEIVVVGAPRALRPQRGGIRRRPRDRLVKSGALSLWVLCNCERR